MSERVEYKLPDRVDATNASGIQNEMDELTKDSSVEFVIDFSGNKYVSSAGLRAILFIQKKLSKGGGREILTNVPDSVKEIFDREGTGMSYASWALRFVASKDNILTVLSGMSNIAQMEDNLSFMKNMKPLDEHEEEVIRKAQEALDKDQSIPCTACRYCTKGCPMNIPIPDIFAVENRKKGSPEFRTKREYTIVTTGKGRASDCIQCGQCEGVCPQHLPIISLLKDAAEKLDR